MAKKISTSKERIAEMMAELNLKQADIVQRTGISKSSLSHYLSGKRTPNQEQLSVISDPYGINPAWLMGYDVPMWLKDTPRSFSSPEEFEKAWQEAGGAPHQPFTVPWTDHGAHKLILTPEEESFILEVRSIRDYDKDFYNRMKAYIKALKEMRDNHD